MKNFVQSGNTLSLTAPYDVAPGDGMLVGSVFGVATGGAATGVEIEATLAGVYDLKKTLAQAWTQGARIYWDNTAKEATATAAGNTLIGVAVKAVANPSPIGRVRLNGSF